MYNDLVYKAAQHNRTLCFVSRDQIKSHFVLVTKEFRQNSCKNRVDQGYVNNLFTQALVDPVIKCDMLGVLSKSNANLSDQLEAFIFAKLRETSRQTH